MSTTMHCFLSYQLKSCVIQLNNKCTISVCQKVETEKSQIPLEMTLTKAKKFFQKPESYIKTFVFSLTR